MMNQKHLRVEIFTLQSSEQFLHTRLFILAKSNILVSARISTDACSAGVVFSFRADCAPLQLR